MFFVYRAQLYQQEHELLRELAQVDGDLDKHRNRVKVWFAVLSLFVWPKICL